jgi:hypothetical protein
VGSGDSVISKRAETRKNAFISPLPRYVATLPQPCFCDPCSINRGQFQCEDREDSMGQAAALAGKLSGPEDIGGERTKSWPEDTVSETQLIKRWLCVNLAEKCNQVSGLLCQNAFERPKRLVDRPCSKLSYTWATNECVNKSTR